ncbi:MAG TPA: hypothetical protein VH374_16750 [Polyangia bacterium]|jgi:hypothetical protein|nr:hypothetical protein [Polyangia bacterium]
MRDLRARLSFIAVTPVLLLAGCTSSVTAPPSFPTGGQGGVDAGMSVDGTVVDVDQESPSPTDAGPTDAPIVTDVPDVVTDAASDLDVPSGDGACSNLFCEDFEQGMIDPAKWNAQMGGSGTLEVQQQIIHSGKYAYHVHGSGASQDFAMIIATDVPAALKGAGPLYGRAYVYANTNVGSHIELGFAGSTSSPTVAPTITKGMNFNYMEFANYSNSWQLGFDLFAPAPDIAKGFVEEASYPPARDKYPAGTWNCLEWEFGDNPDLMVLWVDGQQIDQFDVQHIDYTSVARTAGSVLNGKSSGVIGGYNFFGFGFHSYGASTTVERYFDDIAIDIKRVGCLPDAPSGVGKAKRVGRL